MKGPMTGPLTTKKGGKDADWLMKCGNDGNTKGTTLPKGGCPRGAKKMGKRRKGY